MRKYVDGWEMSWMMGGIRGIYDVCLVSILLLKRLETRGGNGSLNAED